MCPAGSHESIKKITKLEQNLKFVVYCKNVVERIRHLHIQIPISGVRCFLWGDTQINRLLGLQGCELRRRKPFHLMGSGDMLPRNILKFWSCRKVISRILGEIFDNFKDWKMLFKMLLN